MKMRRDLDSILKEVDSLKVLKEENGVIISVFNDKIGR